MIEVIKLSELPYVFEVNNIENNSSLERDILNGKAIDILISLLYDSKNIHELSKELKIPSYSTQLYIKRLIANQMIKVNRTEVINQRKINYYELTKTDIEILNFLKESDELRMDETKIEMSAKHFSSMTSKAIKNINKYRDKPYKIKAYFIKSDENSMSAFKDELDQLFIKYQALEDEEAKDTYSFISVLAPFKMAEADD